MRHFYLSALCLVSVELFAQQKDHSWWAPPAMSQLPDIDSISSMQSKQRLLLDFEHALSLYKWSTSIYATSSGFITVPTISLRAEARSRLRDDAGIRTSEAGLALTTDYPLTPEKSSLLLAFSATSYSQDQKASTTVANIAKLSSINDGSATIGARHLFTDNLQAEASGGITVKAIEERESYGPILRSRIMLSSYDLDEDIAISGAAYLDERRYNISNEVLRNDGINLSLNSQFADGGWNNTRAGITLKRRDFYFPRDTSDELVRQERSEFLFEVHNNFFYPVVKDKLNVELSLDVAPRTITRRVPGIDLSSLSSQFLTGTTFLAPSTSSSGMTNVIGSLQYLFPSGSLSTEIRYEEHSEQNSLLLEDAAGLSPSLSKKVSDALNATSFEAKSTVAAARLITNLSSSDALVAELNARIYRFDTPSEDNVDDRDEQYLYGNLQYSHRFNPELHFSSELRLARGHLVYIESDRSAQNNRTRTIAFSNTVRFLSPRLRNTFSGEVFANFTVYDFLLPSAVTANDFIIRGLSAQDSCFIDLDAFNAASTNWGLLLRGEYRLSERGSYNDQEFSERPLLETSELLTEALLQCSFTRITSPALIRIGVRSFLLNRRSAQNNVSSYSLKDDERSLRIGPLVTVVLDQLYGSGARLFGTLWYGFVTTDRYTDNASISGKQVEARLTAEWRF